MANVLTSEDRILTTHSGRLPGSPALADFLKSKAEGRFDPAAYYAETAAAVAACLRRQAASGVDILGAGEEKTSFSLYAQDRLAGLEPRPGRRFQGFKAAQARFLEDFEPYLQELLRTEHRVPHIPLACAGPIEYIGQDDLQQEISNLKAATRDVSCSGVFMSSISPAAVGRNEYYRDHEEFLHHAGEALRVEYKAIVEAGFILQIEDATLPSLFCSQSKTGKTAEVSAGAQVSALNHSLRGIAPEQIRYHVSCGPKVTPHQQIDAPRVAHHMLQVNAGAYSFDGRDLFRGEAEDAWDLIRLPPGKVIMPTLVKLDHSEIEDPDVIAEGLTRFAKRVGRDSLVANADGGAAASSGKAPHALIWAKLAALRAGAERASQRLWS
ncbi:MAG: Methionine synthase vitamin-B12 independent protein [Phenylobacterium sp.]|nr:Methionine synthase vitamin-B12 independent protein [Phenylobacterium sp.]